MKAESCKNFNDMIYLFVYLCMNVCIYLQHRSDLMTNGDFNPQNDQFPNFPTWDSNPISPFSFSLGLQPSTVTYKLPLSLLQLSNLMRFSPKSKQTFTSNLVSRLLILEYLWSFNITLIYSLVYILYTIFMYLFISFYLFNFC